MVMSGDQQEAARQAAVLQDLWRMAFAGPASTPAPWREAGDRLNLGLAAYRGNAQATAEKALTSTYPTVQALLGEEAMGVLARQLWHHHPPRMGDLTQWGQALPAWLAELPEVQDWPYLPDCARLDWARHNTELAADAEFESESLALLGEAEPAQLILQLRPGLAVIPSPWPIVSIFEAHRNEHDAADALGHVLSAPQAETAVVWRTHWRAEVSDLPAPMVGWMLALSCTDHPPNLQILLDQADPGFDLGKWLALALRQGWLWRVTRIGLSDPED
jgi:hypothetical protein